MHTFQNFTLGKPNLYLFAQNMMHSTAPKVAYSINLVVVIIYIKKIIFTARMTRNNLGSVQHFLATRKQIHDPKVKKLKAEINKYINKKSYDFRD